MKAIKYFILSLWPIQFFLKRILPFVRFSTTYAKITGPQYQQFVKNAKRGHIVLIQDRRRLSHYLVKGNMDHAAIVVMESDKWQVSEMVHTGFNKTTLFDIAKESDRIIILELEDKSLVEPFVQKSKTFEKTKYDTLFSMRSKKSLYCTELVTKSVDKKAIGLKGFGEVLPDDLLMASGLKIIWDSDWRYLDCPVLLKT